MAASISGKSAQLSCSSSRTLVPEASANRALVPPISASRRSAVLISRIIPKRRIAVPPGRAIISARRRLDCGPLRQLSRPVACQELQSRQLIAPPLADNVGMTNTLDMVSDTGPNAAPMSVLVVDDDRELCRMLTEYLGPEGFVLQCVNDGETALYTLDRHHFDLIVLDIMLTRISG